VKPPMVLRSAYVRDSTEQFGTLPVSVSVATDDPSMNIVGLQEYSAQSSVDGGLIDIGTMPQMNDDDPSRSSSVQQYPKDISLIEPWKQDSFLYKLLTESFKLNPEYLLYVLQDSLYIYNTETFLEFLKDSPNTFLGRVPVSIPGLLHPHQAIFTFSMITKFIGSSLHANEAVYEYAAIYDATFSQTNQQHKDVLQGIGRHDQQMATMPKLAFQDAFIYTLARVTSTSSLRESHDSFNPSLGRKVASTLSALVPVPAMEYQRTPIVKPISPPDMFTNENQPGLHPSTQYHSAQQSDHNQDPSDSSSSSSDYSTISSTGQRGVSYPSNDDNDDPPKIREYFPSDDDNEDPPKIREYLFGTERKHRKKSKKMKKGRKGRSKAVTSTSLSIIRLHGQPDYWTQGTDIAPTRAYEKKDQTN
jgi:hypothetical protein